MVECQKSKSRLIRAECVNEKGIVQVQKALLRLGISSQLKLRNRKKGIIWRLNICGLEKLKRFQHIIGFIHPKKDRILAKAIAPYKNYSWNIPSTKTRLIQFIRLKGKLNARRKEIRFWSILKKNLLTLRKNLYRYKIPATIHGPWKNQYGSVHYCLAIKLNDHKAYKNLYR